MSTRQDSLHLDQQLCFPLYAATNLVQQLYHPLLKPLGLTYSQYLVMLVLWELCPESAKEVPEITVGDIRSRLKLDIGTLSPLLKRMENAGHITRQRSVHDERCVIIGLTPEGSSLRKQAQDIPSCVGAKLNLPKEDITALREDIHKLVDRLYDLSSQKNKN